MTLTYCDNCPCVDYPKRKTEMIETSTYIRKPLIVEGVQVSDENMVQVAGWCGGIIDNTPSKRNYIKLQQVPVTPNTRQNMAFPGDWVLKSDMGFKIYSKRAFDRTFDPQLS